MLKSSVCIGGIDVGFASDYCSVFLLRHKRPVISALSLLNIICSKKKKKRIYTF